MILISNLRFEESESLFSRCFSVSLLFHLLFTEYWVLDPILLLCFTFTFDFDAWTTLILAVFYYCAHKVFAKSLHWKWIDDDIGEVSEVVIMRKVCELQLLEVHPICIFWYGCLYLMHCLETCWQNCVGLNLCNLHEAFPWLICLKIWLMLVESTLFWRFFLRGIWFGANISGSLFHLKAHVCWFCNWLMAVFGIILRGPWVFWPCFVVHWILIDMW